MLGALSPLARAARGPHESRVAAVGVSAEQSGRIQAFLDSLTWDQLVDRLDLALEGARLGIWDWDLRDDSVRFDRRWCEMLGLDHHAIAMDLSTWSERVHPDDIEQCFADIRAHVEGRAPYYENVHRMRHADGEWRYILDRGRISGRDEDGNPIRMTGTHFDLTASERTKRALAEQQAQLVQLVRHLPDAVAMVDMHMRYIACSDRWIRDYALEDVPTEGRSHYDIFPTVPDRWKAIHARALAGEQLSAKEDRFVREDGRVHWIDWDCRPWRNAAGQIAGMLMMSADVTERVRARHQRETQSRLAALGLMSGGIAHEVNTPLYVLGLEFAFLEEELRAEAPDLDLVRQSMDAFGEALERVGAIVKAMRAVSRRAEDDPLVDVDLCAVIANVHTLTNARFGASGVELRIEAPKDGIYVRGRGAEIGQVLLNLVTNALDAAKSAELPRVELTVRAEGDATSVLVTDNGPGIAPADVERIFDPFFTTKAVGDGTGLGLSISHAIAERLGGALELESSCSPTIFRLRLASADPSGVDDA